MTEYQLLVVAETCPENMLFAEESELLSFVRDEWNAPDLRQVALAELVSRWCVSGNVGLAAELSSLIGDAWRSFSDWYNINRSWTGERFHPVTLSGWGNVETFPGFGEVLRRRLDRLCEADGFIPVCNESGAWFIPFRLEESAEGALWADGGEVDVWKDCVRRALAGTGFKGVRLQLRKGDGIAVTGESLMLPVRMAAMRDKPGGLPGYDVLRVIATGSFDEQFRLADVGLRQKIEAAGRQFRDVMFFGPDVPGETTGFRYFRSLEAGLDESAVFERIRDELERIPGCVKMSRDYALRRLPDMASNVDRENHFRWTEVACQLEQLKDTISARRDPEVWLEFSSLLATALCHAGRTEDSRRCADEARAFARERGYEAKALRLEVTAAVNAQDMGDVEECRVLGLGLEKALAHFDGDEKDDLLMRHHGTEAQANAWGVVFGIPGYSIEAAEMHAEAAVDKALRIARSAPPEKRDEAESNLAQDLNYRHLVLALFKPGTKAEESAFEEAQRQLRELSDRAARTNRYHQMRQKSLALFNAWRTRGETPAEVELAKWRLSLDAEGWQIAANRTHLGVLAAAIGDVDEAKRCFREGDEKLPLSRCWAPVIASIRLVLLLHAACSLREKDAATAAECLHKAEEVTAKFGESRLFGVIRADLWMSAARSGSGSRNLPQFYY